MDSTQGFHAIMNVLADSNVAVVRSGVSREECVVLAEGRHYGESPDIWPGRSPVGMYGSIARGSNGTASVCVVTGGNHRFRID